MGNYSILAIHGIGAGDGESRKGFSSNLRDLIFTDSVQRKSSWHECIWEDLNDKIDNQISSIVSSIGNYRLAKALSPDGYLYVSYVGRSDSDVATRIADHLGEGYRYFRFCYQPSRRAAYEQECRDYHKYGGDKGILDNEIHPASPAFMSYKCPYC